jgi:hypothetical protein
METRTVMRGWSALGLILAVAGLAACSGGARGVAGMGASAPHAGMSSKSATSSPGSSYGADQAAPSMESAAPPAPAARAPEPPSAAERPGLGTEWGETRFSQVSNTSFDRADGNRPWQVASLYYNDHEGARAMARYSDYREVGNAVVNVPGLGVSVSLNDDAGRPLPAFFAGGRTYAIGEAGQRYTIIVRNQSGMRLEAVASVDGLDVIDGKSANFSKRGYVVSPWDTVEIDGFRQTDDHVAAFRFGSVRDSYAARTGNDRNVGIIGVAFFRPSNGPSWPWTHREIERRHTADPFPGGYASPPPPRW